MERVGVFVDAGYLFAAGGQLLAGTKVSRGELELDIGGVVAALKRAAEEWSGLPLLRIYWYDGTDSGPSRQHTDLAFQSEIKVRLGIVNKYGEQKGVDSLLVTDMINLARNRAMSTAILITGDEDIRVGVQQAQEHGVRVHLVGIEPVERNQSNLLVQEADATAKWTKEQLSAFLRHRPPVRVAQVAVPAGGGPEEVITAVVDAVVSRLEPEIRKTLRAGFAGGDERVPSEHDRVLLRTLGEHIESIEFQHKVRLRELFRQRV